MIFDPLRANSSNDLALQKKVAPDLRGNATLAKTMPGLLLDVSYDDKGKLDRESYMTKVVAGKQVVTRILQHVNKK